MKTFYVLKSHIDRLIMGHHSEHIHLAETVLIAIMFLFLLQLMTTLIESIYMLDLLNTTLDEKVLGVLFFFTTVGLFFIKESHARIIVNITGIAAIIFRCLYPFFSTSIKLILSGCGFGCMVLFFPAYFLWRRNSDPEKIGTVFGCGVAISVFASILFRTLNSTLDVTEYGDIKWIGWALGFIALVHILLLNFSHESEHTLVQEVKRTAFSSQASILGIFAVLSLLYFGYASPAVFSRWTEANYIVLICLFAISIGIYLILMVYRPQMFRELKPAMVWIWNAFFIVTLMLSIILNQVEFINTNDPSPLIVELSNWYQILPIYLNACLVPILFIDFSLATRNLIHSRPTKTKLIGNFLLGEFIVVVLIFMFIFTNIWGYVEPISFWFRGLFWLPFMLLGILLCVSLLSKHLEIPTFMLIQPKKAQVTAVIIIGIFSGGIILGAFMSTPMTHTQDTSGIDRVKVVTYNIQQGVNKTGQKNVEAQLQLLQELNPDIIGLEECDTPKIGTGNYDIVRYFADHLGYYVYYGPKTVMQTYGVALLSRYPIENPRSFYTHSNEDEIGSIQAQVLIGETVLNVFVNHPAGSADSKLDHIQSMLKLAEGLTNVITMGDFNWRENTSYYNKTTIDFGYLDTWRTKWPTGVDDQSVIMTTSIDHVFVSPTFSVVDARYILSPESQTDHPLYWTTVLW